MFKKLNSWILTSVLCWFFLAFSSKSTATPFYHHSFLPFYQHTLSNLQSYGELLEIDDGSIWKINPYHKHYLSNWRACDILEISATNTVSGERFYITNKTLNTYVLAELSLGPIINNPYTNHITWTSQRELIITSVAGLETRWIVDLSDTSKLVFWKQHEAIIIGKHTPSWFNWHDTNEVILINVDKNEFIKAKLF
jgi:hypothetical protein